jgi:hypothetical protein
MIHYPDHPFAALPSGDEEDLGCIVVLTVFLQPQQIRGVSGNIDG